MQSGWALGTNDALYYTQTDAQHWTKLGKFPWTRFSVGNHGHLAWGVTFPQRFPRGTTKSAIVVEAVNPQGKLWQRTIYPPEKRLVLLQWSATPTAPLAGLVLSARTSPSNLAEEVWTFNAATRQASLSYKANPIPQTESPMTAVGVESSSQAWGTSISPGPGPGLWSIRSGKASPILLSIPKGLTHGPVGPIKPAPIATPQFVDGTGFLAANYQTISLSSQTQVADALLYRTRGKRWVPVWHRPGYIDLANFITPKIGWIEWAAIAGARPALFKTVNGGRTFVHGHAWSRQTLLHQPAGRVVDRPVARPQAMDYCQWRTHLDTSPGAGLASSCLGVGLQRFAPRRAEGGTHGPHPEYWIESSPTLNCSIHSSNSLRYRWYAERSGTR